MAGVDSPLQANGPQGVFRAPRNTSRKANNRRGSNVKWAKVIDERRCIGCHACTVACKSEHDIPIGVTRTYVRQVETGVFPSVRRTFQVTRCNQCENPPCVGACPTGAMYQRPDGIVDFNRSVCIGCKGCIAACPYDAIYIDPETHSAEKCNFCSHRIDSGLQPACVSACPTQAILFGDMNDPESAVSQLIATEKTQVRRPEKGTSPKLFYVEADETNLDPHAAAFRNGYMAAESPSRAETAGPHRPELGAAQDPQGRTSSGYPGRSAAAAIMSYKSEAETPWDWHISVYTWTKSIASGSLLLAAIGAIFGGLNHGASWNASVAALSAVFLALTGLVLVGDISHPERFYLVLLRPRWGSWLARGAYLITSFAVLLGLLLIVALLHLKGATTVFFWIGLFLAPAVGVYTAFILSQSKGRDMWQNPLVPVHFLTHSAVAGASALAILSLAFHASTSSADVVWLRWALGATLAVHIALVLSELVMPHATRHGVRAAWNMTRGRWSRWFWGGLGLSIVAIVVVAIPGLAAAAAVGFLALAGLLMFQHAYIQAGQSVPQS